jgi:prolyl oligopeptidase
MVESTSNLFPKITEYPSAHRSDHVDTYGKHQVADPYKWLEDENSAETKAFIDAHVNLT